MKIDVLLSFSIVFYIFLKDSEDPRITDKTTKEIFIAFLLLSCFFCINGLFSLPFLILGAVMFFTFLKHRSRDIENFKKAIKDN